jgi:apolipoprotein N-acyltransferase
MLSMRVLKPSWLTLLSGALIVLAFPHWNVTFLIWFALCPWLFQLRQAVSWKQALVQGLWLSIFMSLGGFYWVASVLNEFAGLPWPVAIFGLLLYSLIGQPQFTLFAPLYFYFRGSRRSGRLLVVSLASIAGLAASYTAIDWMIPKLFVDTLGHAFFRYPNLRQVADLGGASLLTFLVFLASEAIVTSFDMIKNRNEPSIWPAIRKASLPLLAAGLVCAAATAYGWKRSAEIQELLAQAPSRVRAAVIQANIGDFDKVAAEKGLRGAADTILTDYFSLSDEALSRPEKPDFLVWPETAYPSTFRTPSTTSELYRDQKVEGYVRNRSTPLLFGGYDHADKKDFNALFLLSPTAIAGSPTGNRFELASSAAPFTKGSDLQIYRKNILLLFGEYIPGAESIKLIRDAFPQVGNFGRGDGPGVLSVPLSQSKGALKDLKIGPVICYEALFPDYVIEAARKGSQLILNITNDSWFGAYGEPYLHLALVTFRSVETRLPQLRATNTGISALIMADGEMVEQTGVNERKVMNVSIPITPPIPTVLKAWGDWFGPFSAGMALVLLFLAPILSANKKRP